MAEEGEEQQQHGGVEQASSPEQKASATEKTAPLSSPSVDIWPPSQRTRDAVINRLVETLSTPSVLSKRYGTLTHEEATDSARVIEEAAIAAASASAVDGTLADTIDGQIEILQIYSKEISKRMIESVKAKSTAAAVSPSPVISDTTAEEMSPPPAPSASATIEIPTAETETRAS